MSTITVPQPDDISRMSRVDAEKARTELARKALGILSDDAASADDLRAVADIQLATGQIGERLDALADARSKAVEFQRIQEAAERGLATKAPEAPSPAERADLPGIMAKSALGRAAIDAWKAGGEAPAGSVDVPLGAVFGKSRWFQDLATKATLGIDSGETNVDTDYPSAEARIPGVVEELFQSHNIADLFPNIPWTGDQVDYVIEDVVDEGAAETAEGDDADEAELDFTPASTPIRKITVILPVTLEGLNTEAFMRSHVQSRIGTFSLNREDRQLLNGAGTGVTLTGINATDNINTIPLASGSTGQLLAEAFFAGSVAVGQSFLTPTAGVVSLATWQALRLAKDAEERYLNAAITEAGVPRVFGLRLVFNENQTDYIESGGGATTSGIVGTVVSRDAANVYRRMGLTITWTDSDEGNFKRDITTFKATHRVGLAVLRPAGISVIEVGAS